MSRLSPEFCHLKIMNMSQDVQLKFLLFLPISNLVPQDNVAIQHVMASYLPGHYFPEGRHHVLYQATDADGNRARHIFI